MGSNTIIAIVVGAILVIVGFALWPVLNGASNSLYSYFQDSCDDGNGNRFGKAYVGIDNTKLAGRELGSSEYNTSERVHGGSGANIVGSSGQCKATGIQGGESTLADSLESAPFYNEQGDKLTTQYASDTGQWYSRSSDPFLFVEVAPMLKRFSGINNLLLTVIPVVSIAGFLGISGAKLYSYGKGTSSIGSSIIDQRLYVDWHRDCHGHCWPGLGPGRSRKPSRRKWTVRSQWHIRKHHIIALCNDSCYLHCRLGDARWIASSNCVDGWEERRIDGLRLKELGDFKLWAVTLS